MPLNSAVLALLQTDGRTDGHGGANAVSYFTTDARGMARTVTVSSLNKHSTIRVAFRDTKMLAAGRISTRLLVQTECGTSQQTRVEPEI